MGTAEGFLQDRLRILPADVARAATSAPVTRDLLVTDVGWFPRARNHGRRRRWGTSAAVVIICSAGRGWCSTAEENLSVRAGQTLIIPPDLPHSYDAVEGDPWTIAWMHVSGPQLRAFEAALPDGPRRAVVVDLHDPIALQGLMEDLMTTSEVDDRPATLMRASGIAWHVLARLAADVEAGPPGRREPVRRVLSHLRVHFDQPVVITELAAMAGLSSSHFAALFREATGGGVVEYVKHLRIATACELLVTTSMPVGAIGRMVGYEDPLYFSRQFRRMHGCSPSTFRERETIDISLTGDRSHT